MTLVLPPPVESRDVGRKRVRLIAIGALVFAGAVLGFWLWTCICRFPSIPWNDMRLAPAVALRQGHAIYSTAHQGTINTWMYGPLPLLFYWPAAWASSAADALIAAGMLNVLITVVPLALVCFGWPGANQGRATTAAHVATLLLCLTAWPALHYTFIFSDNVAVACGLVGNLLLVRARTSRERWLAALIATAALAAKQICIGIPLAQILWCAVIMGRREAVLHLCRCLVSGAALAGGAVIVFGSAPLWFSLVDVPASLSWAPQPGRRLVAVAWEAGLQIVMPAAVMIVGRRAFVAPSLLLPALAWLCTLPLGSLALFKVGGWMNSIHSFVLWLPPVLVTFLTSRWISQRIWPACLIAATLAIAGTAARMIREERLSLRPQIAAHLEAAELASHRPGRIWFPLHPLITLYSDRRYYHDEDGFYIRRQARKSISAEHAAAHLPPAMHLMAFANDWNDWGIARSMMPPNATERTTPMWTILDGSNTDTRP